MNTPREQFHQAIDQQDIWKPGEMRSFAIAVVAAGIHALKMGRLKFSTDDVSETDHPQSPGIAGSVIEKLKNAHVIESVGVVVGDKFYPDRIRSNRPNRKSAYIGLYKLCSLNIANEFLARNGREIAIKQLELTPAK